MFPMILANARCIFQDGVREGSDIVVRDGKIAEIRESSKSREAETLDLVGNYLAPGFIDLHIHGAMGRDTMEASAEAFRAICDYHGSGGTTSLLLTTVTAPIPDIINVLRAARECPDGIPQIAGVHVEGPFISHKLPGAQPEQFIRNPDPESTRQLLEYADVIKRVTLAPELPGALDLVGALRARKIGVSGGHSDAREGEARAAFARGMRHVTHTFNCMSSARREGAFRIAGLLEYALSKPEIMCELIAELHHASATLMRMLYRAKGADGICLVTDATAGAGLKAGSRFLLFGRECEAGPGAAFLAGQSTLAGSTTRMIDLVRTMVEQVRVPLDEAIRMASSNPARALKIDSAKGKLARDADADFVVLSPKLEVLQTFVGGKRVFPGSPSTG